jgi:hypothetical protein
VALLALIGAAQVRGAGRQMLWVAAMSLVAPIAISPAGSPRNLVAGTALLLALGSDAICRYATRRRAPDTRPSRKSKPSIRGPALPWVLALLLTLSASVYGLGTVLETLRPTAWPRSSAATALRQESLGWRDAANREWDRTAWHFAVDYSIASQLRYYTGLPVQTAWGQYRIWGIPELEGNGQEDKVVIVALPYVDTGLVSERLQVAFQQTEGPIPLPLREGSKTKRLNAWSARGRLVDAGTFLQMFDLLGLAEATRAQER